MISGEWTGAMALTESSAGTDLGLLSTRAVPNADGSFAITGTKIFISSGDQDFGGNIVHLVLARLPDAPKGVKGISLFLAPKFLVNADGSLGARNSMSVGAMERSEEHTSELQSPMRISYAVFCLNNQHQTQITTSQPNSTNTIKNYNP